MVNLLDAIRRHCPELNGSLLDRHCQCLPQDYFERYAPAEVARHLRLLASLVEETPVAVEVRLLAASTFEVLVVGENHSGTVACLTAALAANGFDLEDIQVATYLEPEPAVPERWPHYFVIVVRVRGAHAGRPTDLATGLRVRLVPALRHLARGSFAQAQAVAAGLRPETALLRDTLTPAQLEGLVLGGDFRLERKLTTGGTSQVYLATQLSLNRTVAVKVSRYEGAADDSQLARFSQEAVVLGRFDCPHIVRVYAAGTMPGRAGGVVGWIAVEYLAGGDLARWLQFMGPPGDAAARWFRQALEGLRYANRRGIVHRDLKPHNLLLTSEGVLKLSDFGLLLEVQTPFSGSEPGRSPIMGTPHYMSPEQAQGETLDERSDIFALGSTFYHLLSGQLPFEAPDVARLLAQITRQEAAPLTVVAPHVARPLAILIQRMMARRREDRYQDVEAILADLAGYERRGLLQFAEAASFSPLPPPDCTPTDSQTEAYPPPSPSA